MTDPVAAALEEIGQALRAVDPAEREALVTRIAAARHVMVYGCGREGLMMRALAMRLAHLGLGVSVQGDMAAPPLGPGDLFLAACGPGRLGTVDALARVALEAGAQVWMLTAEPEGATVALAHARLVIPARTMARAGTGALPMGSVFEGALFLLGEMVVADLAARLGQGPDAMAARHTNME